MSDQRIVFTVAGDEVPTKVLAPGFRVDENGNKRRTTVAEMQADVPVGATAVREITTAELPANRNYRNAWDDSNPENFVGINAAKAGVIANKRRTDKRAVIFAPYEAIVEKAARGTPLKANENAVDAAQAMTDYKTNVDDVAQIAIAAGVLADDWTAIEAAEVAAGLI